MPIARLRHPPGPLSAGLTALELMVSLAIVAVLLAAATPALRGISAEQRMRAAVSRLLSDLAFARSEAIHGAAEVVLCPLSGGRCADTTQWQHGWLVFHDLNGDREPQAVESVLRQAGPLEGVRVSGSSHRMRLRFFPNGTAPGSNATLSFCDERGAAGPRQVSLSASGRIREKPAATVTDDTCD